MHPILKLVVQRVALGLLLLLAVSAVIFLGVEALPGDTAQAILGQQATPEALANLREKMGLNEPPLTRYFQWLGGVLTGDLGTALTNGADIATSIGQRLGNTLVLAGCAAVIAVPLAIILGLVAARYAGKWPDKVISGITLSTISLPEFVAAYFVIYIFTQLIPIFQPVAMVFPGMSFWAKLNAVALPVIVLVLVVLAHMMRMTRAAILNVMQSAYIETAELKGLSPMTVIWRHACSSGFPASFQSSSAFMLASSEAVRASRRSRCARGSSAPPARTRGGTVKMTPSAAWVKSTGAAQLRSPG